MERNYQRICSILFYTFFFIYLSLLLHALIFQRIHWPMAMRSINIVPFYTISNYVLEFVRGSVYSRFAFDNLFFNILFFTPLGLYLPILRSGKKTITYFSWILSFSLAVEILQWCFRLGAADIDDVILNSFGGFLGLMAYKALFAVFKQQKRVRFCITVLSTVAGIPALYFAYRHIFGIH